MATNPRSNRTIRPLALAAVLATAASLPAWAAGGGAPDPSEEPVVRALVAQVDHLSGRFLKVTGIIEPTDLPMLQRLADELGRIHAHFELAAVGGTAPDPHVTPLNEAMLDLHKQAVALQIHVLAVRKKVGGNPLFELSHVTRTLGFLDTATRTLITRIEYALPSVMAAPSDL